MIALSLVLLLTAFAPPRAVAQQSLNVHCAARSASGQLLVKVSVPTSITAAKRLSCHYADGRVVTLRLESDCTLAHVDLIDEVMNVRECLPSAAQANKCQVVCGAQ